VVVGASMAGLLTARVLADYFQTVTVIERDTFPDEPIARRGVPQGRHIHLLLPAGRATLEDLFPGYGEDIVSNGGVVIDASRDVLHYEEGGFLADGPRPIPLYLASRPLYEHLVRRRVAEHERIELRQSCQWVEFLVDEDATTVQGVTIRTDEGTSVELRTELVVDATGRTSRTPNWLANHGYSEPEVKEVFVDIAYSTVRIERPVDDRRMVFLPHSPPRTRGGSTPPIEDGGRIVTLFGVHGDHPPTDRDGLIEFAASLPIPHFERLLDSHPWISEEVAHYPFPANIRRHYENLDRFPDRLLVIGDALTSFNPIYGQGMSVAALEALVLHHTLTAGGCENLAGRFFDRAEGVIDTAWKMAVGSDFAFPQTEGTKPRGTDLSNRYVSRLRRRAHDDGVLRDAFYQVIGMEEPPTTLFHPRIMWRTLKPTT
jgi:2-polyprenyl-6-methoxyphenol hydroxylase-like FAD-dependent oxidoreductase